MLLLVRTFMDGFRDIIDSISDPRVKNWPLMSSPFPTLAICLCYVYLVKVLGPRLMQNRKPMELKGVIIAYNIFQVCFNGWLFYQGLAAGWWFDYSFRCQPVDYSNTPKALAIARVCWWYFFSKFTDFFDTIFFVLRKKNNHISTLHMVHHTIMPMCVWLGLKIAPGGHGTFFGLVNTFVHVVMYTYYLLAAFGPRFEKYLWWKKYLTVLQMVQFVLVFIHSLQPMFFECDYPKVFGLLPCLPAVMFYCLFADFYRQAYKMQRPNKQAISTATTQKESDPQQEQNGFSRKDQTALNEHHDAPPDSYTTQPRHREVVNSMARE